MFHGTSRGKTTFYICKTAIKTTPRENLILASCWLKQGGPVAKGLALENSIKLVELWPSDLQETTRPERGNTRALQAFGESLSQLKPSKILSLNIWKVLKVLWTIFFPLRTKYIKINCQRRFVDLTHQACWSPVIIAARRPKMKCYSNGFLHLHDNVHASQTCLCSLLLEPIFN